MKVALVVFTLFWANVTSAMLESKFLYFPTHNRAGSPLKEWKVKERLIGFWNGNEKPTAIWLVCHGNGGQASQRSYFEPVLPSSTGMYVVEYPGYGSREGEPSMKSINAAAEEAYTWLRERYRNLPVNVIGESLGSGPAAHLCSLENPPDRAVFVVPFDTMLDLAKRRMPLLPVSLLLRDRWNNISALQRYRGQVDIFAASQDDIIPSEHAKNLASSIPQARFHEVPGGHNDWSAYVKVAP